MIDAERMLGSLVRNAMSGGGKRGRSRNRRRGRRGRGGVGRSLLGGAGKGALAMGALGVAMAAFEHFSKQQKTGTAFSGGAPSVAPPPPLPPPPGQAAASGSPPPPPPPPGATASPDQSAGPVTDSAPSSDEALFLVRAMIAAANADNEVDDEEQGRILQALDASGLGAEERQFVLAELQSPADVVSLAAQATTPELARQVYLASLMAIEVDTQAEEDYLSRLAQELGLDETTVAELENLLDGEETE